MTREAAFERFKDAVRHVWRNADFVLPHVELSAEPPKDPTVFASLGQRDRPTAISNSIIRVSSLNRLHVAAPLLAEPEDVFWKVLVHEACHLGYANHGQQFIDLCRGKGGAVSESAIHHDVIACQRKVGARFKTEREFPGSEAREAARWCKEQRRLVGGRWRLTQ